MDDSVVEKRMADRRQQYKNVSEHMKKEDESRTRAYGWSIPAAIDTSLTTSIPVPVCCRPLLEQQPSLKVTNLCPFESSVFRYGVQQGYCCMAE